MTAVDDATILRMAADQAEPLLPVLDRTRAFRPLIVVLAILPALVALERRGLDNAGAVWALRSLALTDAWRVPPESAHRGDAGLVRGERRGVSGLADQPPLVAWLTASLLRVPYLSPLFAPLVISLLSASACVWWGYRLFAGLGESRLGFWTAVWLAVQGGTCLLATSASPTPLALLLALIAFGAWERHLVRADAMVSVWLLLSGIALGVCLLAGGPIAGVFVAVLLLHRLIVALASLGNRGWHRNGRGAPLRWFVSLAVALTTAFAVGGWWVMEAASLGGETFWNAWLPGYDVAVWRELSGGSAGVVAPSNVDWLARTVAVIGPILPLTLFGLWCVVRDLWRGPVDSPRDNTRQLHSRALLAAWLAAAVAFHAVSPHVSWGGLPYRTLSETYLLFPALACAALAVEDLLHRRLSFGLSLLLTAAVVLLLPVSVEWESEGYTRGDFTSWQVLATLGGLVVGAWLVLRWTRDREARRQIAMYGLLGIQIGAVLGAAFITERPQLPEESRLNGFRDELSQQAGYDRAVLIADRPPPTRLEFVLRSTAGPVPWTRAETWNAAVSAVTGEAARSPAASGSPNASPTGVLVVDWHSAQRQASPVDLRGFELESIGKSRFYRGRELRAFLLKRSAEPSE